MKSLYKNLLFTSLILCWQPLAASDECPLEQVSHTLDSGESATFTSNIFADNYFVSILLQIFGVSLDQNVSPSWEQPFYFSNKDKLTKGIYSAGNPNTASAKRLTPKLAANERIVLGPLKAHHPDYFVYSTSSDPYDPDDLFTAFSQRNFMGTKFLLARWDGSSTPQTIFSTQSKTATTFLLPGTKHQTAIYELGKLSDSKQASENGDYSVAIDGSRPAQKLSHTLPAGREIGATLLLNDKTTYIYTTHNTNKSAVKVFRSRMDTPLVRTELTLVLSPTDQVDSITSTPDGSGFVLSKKASTGRMELLYYQLQDRSISTLSAPTLSSIHSVRFLPNGNGLTLLGNLNNQKVTYQNPLSPNSSTTSDDKKELYFLPLDGSSFRKLNATLHANGSVINYRLIKNNAIYIADQDTDDEKEIYYVDISNNKSPIKISPALKAGQHLNNYHVHNVANDVRLYIQLSQAKTHLPANTNKELYEARLTGDTHKITPDNSFSDGGLKKLEGSNPILFVFATKSIASNKSSLYQYDPISRSALRLSSELESGQKISDIRYLPAINHIMYRTQPNNRFLIDLNQPGTSREINFALKEGGGLSGSIELSADNRRFVYSAKESKESPYAIFSLPVDGSINRIKIAPIKNSKSHVSSFHLSRNSESVIYIADEGDGKHQLYKTCINLSVKEKLRQNSRPPSLKQSTNSSSGSAISSLALLLLLTLMFKFKRRIVY